VGSYGLEEVQTYVKRIQHFIPFEFIELREIKHNKDNRENALLAEEISILKHVRSRDALILFDEKGKQMDSKAFAQFISKQTMLESGSLVFCLGGAYGFSESMRKRAKGMVSLSTMTFPHQLARVIALEQLYRAYTIINHHPYHHV
ncbi:MAG: 23S rRNA (pseudouridine(1915)-N(3))-methyltransferase RlmH, partial [Bacteroidota bacterium]|nr:23S rRNA (pseudouridine(1915)-N(3))-methyltransferase RlmH [Bacteroidota bacterium]